MRDSTHPLLHKLAKLESNFESRLQQPGNAARLSYAYRQSTQAARVLQQYWAEDDGISDGEISADTTEEEDYSAPKPHSMTRAEAKAQNRVLRAYAIAPRYTKTPGRRLWLQVLPKLLAKNMPKHKFERYAKFGDWCESHRRILQLPADVYYAQVKRLFDGFQRRMAEKVRILTREIPHSGANEATVIFKRPADASFSRRKALVEKFKKEVLYEERAYETNSGMASEEIIRARLESTAAWRSLFSEVAHVAFYERIAATDAQRHVNTLTKPSRHWRVFTEIHEDSDVAPSQLHRRERFIGNEYVEDGLYVSHYVRTFQRPTPRAVTGKTPTVQA